MLGTCVKDHAAAACRRVRKPAEPYAESVLAPDDRFEDYVVDGVVGHGGSATVYRAHHAAEPDRTVALKVLDEHHRDAIHMDRLQREFDFANRLDHPHVVPMYECGPGWLAMALVDGGTVSNLATMRDRLAALADVAAALDLRPLERDRALRRRSRRTSLSSKTFRAAAPC